MGGGRVGGCVEFNVPVYRAQLTLSYIAFAVEFPWGGDGSVMGFLAREHFARRYRTTRAFIDRYDEEAVYLSAEVLHAAHWVEQHTAAVQARQVELMRQQAVLAGHGGQLEGGQAGPQLALPAILGQLVILDRRRVFLETLGRDIADIRPAAAAAAAAATTAAAVAAAATAAALAAGVGAAAAAAGPAAAAIPVLAPVL